MRAPEIATSLGSHEPAVRETTARLHEQRIVERIWSGDHTVWRPNPAGIGDRLGWLTVAERMRAEIPRIESLRDDVVAAGYSRVVLLGMGGSSLAAELFGKTFGGRGGCPDLSVLDSTDPEAVLARAEAIDPARTLFIVATKSGTTVETMSFFTFFHGLVVGAAGADRAGERFVAITDPATELAEIAGLQRFREKFLNDPNIGGRYSALSFFGLVPAVLAGVDARALLDRALRMMRSCGPGPAGGGNPAAVLGAVLGVLADRGRDKVTFVISEDVSGFGDWAEQLIAESTGKDERGILPVPHERLTAPSAYGNDRLFIDVRLEGDESGRTELEALELAGHPVVRIGMEDPYDLGGQFFLWELAVAIAGHVIGVQPFDQPDVEAGKTLARQIVERHAEDGALPPLEPTLVAGGIAVYSDSAPDGLEDAIDAFLSQGRPGDYVALQAYLPPGPRAGAALASLRTALREATGLATTVGYGPRFLHSTGQLHKGDGGNGLFIQLTADDARDAPIPARLGSSASSMTFGTLKAAQARGDRRALLGAGRRVIRFHMSVDVAGALGRITDAIGG